MRWFWWAVAILTYFLWAFYAYSWEKVVVILAFVACMLAFEAGERRN
jgi:hypothetical protein